MFVKDIWKTKENAWNITIYQVWPMWFFIDGVLISFCEGKFMCVFHSTRACTSPCSPSKNSHTCACGMYAILIGTLFVPPYFTLGVHTKSTFEKGNFIRLWIWIDYDSRTWPMLVNLLKHAPTISTFFIKPWLLVEYITNQYLHN